jgi:hypothetical protein
VVFSQYVPTLRNQPRDPFAANAKWVMGRAAGPRRDRGYWWMAVGDKKMPGFWPGIIKRGYKFANGEVAV